VTHRGGHAADLAVATFPDHQFQPGGGNRLAVADGRVSGPEVRLGQSPNLRRRRPAVGKVDPFGQRPKGLVVRLALDLDPVGLGLFETGVAQPVLDATVVGQNQQSLAVPIQPASRIDAGDRNEILEARATLAVPELGENPVGLVEEKDAGHGSMITRRPAVDSGIGNRGCP